MSTQIPRRRRLTAREIADRTGKSVRTVYRYTAEPRADFLARAAARRSEAVKLRSEGRKYAEIAERMNISTGIVGRLIHDARKHGEWTAQVQESA